MTLREMRKGKKLTQCELAHCVGVTQAYICALEVGRKKNPSIQVVRKIAAVLDVNVIHIFEALEHAI